MSELEELPYYLDDVWDEFLDVSFRYLYDQWCWEDMGLKRSLKAVEAIRELPNGHVANILYDREGAQMAWMMGKKLAMFTVDKWTGIDIRAVVDNNLTIQVFIERHPAFYDQLLNNLYDTPA